MNTVERVKNIVESLTHNFDFSIFDIEYVKEGSHWYLRIYIDKKGGVSLNDCTQFSEVVSAALDKEEPDPIPHAYFLEVSSPGAERPLKTDEQLREAVGSYIHISLYQAVEGQNTYEGILEELQAETLTISYQDKTRVKEISIPRKLISKARLAIKF
ncbi:ribosome maturation factor RimP [Allofustis seminis]|uniref:ribosome maturation factor RimP n=1 Tax=Allofustis seminis TaxID=166939 RepID=UPI0003791A3B